MTLYSSVVLLLASLLCLAQHSACGEAGKSRLRGDGLPGRRAQHQFVRVPIAADLLLDDKDDVIGKRQEQFDDYGHMRFGKRGEESDDYGHLRFGRNRD